MSNRAALCWLWLASLIIGTALAGTARADAADDYAAGHAADICIRLDAKPTMNGLIGVMRNIEETTSLNNYEIGETVALSVLYVCPIHRPLLQAFADAYATKRAGVAL